MADKDNPGPSTSKSGQNETETSASTSKKAEEDREIVKMWRQMDEKLEHKAKSHNLSAINVKSILHHLIKNPQVLSVLMGIEEPSVAGIPTMKMTRSKAKSTNSDPQNTLNLKPPVLKPKTFLDLDFVEDEEDEDYRPENDDEPEMSDPSDDEEGNITKDTENTIEEDEKESDGESDKLQVAEDPDFFDNFTGPSRSKNLNDAAAPEHRDDHLEVLDLNFQSEDNLFLSNVNEEYVDFLQGIQQNPLQDNFLDDDETNDPDFNILEEFLVFEEAERDPEELRKDKMTEIPRHEVEGLYMDLISEENLPNLPVIIPPEQIRALTPKKAQNVEEEERKPNSGKKSEIRGKTKAEKRLEMIKAMQPVDDSCSLIGDKDKPVKFRPQELDQLKEQLLAHVQLLTQFVILTTYSDQLQNVRNEAQMMINELDDHSMAGGHDSIFNIETLPEALVSCHDILSIIQIPNDRVNWLTVSHPNNYVNDGNPLYAPRPEAALVLSRSRAIRFPDLVPPCQPRIFVYPLNKFTNEENLLYAMGLMQFGHLPTHAGLYGIGYTSYALIQKNFLPIKTELQIKNHLRNAKNSTAVDKNPAMKILWQAATGVCQLVFQHEKRIQRLDTMSEWPKQLQPIWFEHFKISFSPVTTHKMAINEPVVLDFGLSLTSVSTTAYSGKSPNQSDQKVECSPEPEIVIHGGPAPEPRERGSTDSPQSLIIDDREDQPNEPNGYVVDEKSNLPHTPRARSSLSETFYHFASPADTNHDMPIASRIQTPAKQLEKQFGQGARKKRALFRNEDLTTTVIPEEVTTSQDSGDSTTQFFPCVDALRTSSKLQQINERPSTSTSMNSDEGEIQIRRKLKRGRTEIEKLGENQMNDPKYRDVQMAQLARKAAADIKHRMFMHSDMYERMTAILSEEKPISEKLISLRQILNDLPEVYYLLSAFVDDHLVPEDLIDERKREAFKSAIQMICEIEAYFTGAQRYQRNPKAVFKMLAQLEDRLSSREIMKKFAEMLGNEKPLWKRIKRNFGDETFDEEIKPHEFEIIDLRRKDDQQVLEEAQFEVVEGLDEILGKDGNRSDHLQVDEEGQMLMKNASGNVVPISMKKREIVDQRPINKVIVRL
ncbi:hypothetical protein WR25_15706 [Diploscapter pachys]|uniref:Uncharacterized protein n=1 Tax=Diploscapter pachys TaxID=2018661 RepID=A0A2A2J397_9BILA|nr:hypothetical protein WR25_15706 [Diploscapter pachys]